MTSEIFKIFRPHPFKALTADSLPDPGPETSTSTSERPKFIAFSPALVAAIWAAKGVLFLETKGEKWDRIFVLSHLDKDVIQQMCLHYHCYQIPF